MTAMKSQNVASSNKINREIIMQAGILYIGNLSLPIALRRDMSGPACVALRFSSAEMKHVRSDGYSKRSTRS